MDADDIARDAAEILNSDSSLEAREVLDKLKEIARVAHIADVHALQTRLQRLPNNELIMLGLAEMIAFMPKPDAGGADRESLWRELWRRGCGLPAISGQVSDGSQT